MYYTLIAFSELDIPSRNCFHSQLYPKNRHNGWFDVPPRIQSYTDGTARVDLRPGGFHGLASTLALGPATGHGWCWRAVIDLHGTTYRDVA